jgi:hypothetical protein
MAPLNVPLLHSPEVSGNSTASATGHALADSMHLGGTACRPARRPLAIAFASEHYAPISTSSGGIGTPRQSGTLRKSY